MYNVSNDYRVQIRKPYAWRRALRGTIGNVNFTHADVLSGSFSVSNSCSDKNEVKIGTVDMGILQAQFRNGLIPRGDWKDAVITVYDGLYIEATHAYEWVPLGIFTVDEAKYDEKGVKITAYDNMKKFDRAWNISSTIGSPYSILKMICDDCRVQMGMTRAEIEALPNGYDPISLYSDNDCETYRDALYWLAQLLCCFATIGRDGKLYLRMYGNAEIDSVGAGLRFDDNEFSDFVTRYSGISLVNTDDDELIYVSEGSDNYLSYNLGANPFMQYGTMITRRSQMLNILRQLKLIDYVPFETSMLHCPAYDLGDVIEFTGGIADDTKHSCIMFYEYNFEYYAAEGYGSDPALANAKSKVDKNLAGLRSKTDKNSIQFYTFKNAEEAVIEDGERKELIYIRFTTMETKQVTFQAEILADSEATIDEVEAQIEYFLDGAIISDYKPTETWTEDGKHIINLYYMLDVEPNHLYQWQVKMTANGGIITIPQGHARGTVWGQGLVAIGAWDGFIDVEDTILGIQLDSIGISTFDEDEEVLLITPIEISVEDDVSEISLDSIAVQPIDDIVIMNKTSIYYDGMKWQDVYLHTWGAIFDEHTW